MSSWANDGSPRTSLDPSKRLLPSAVLHPTRSQGGPNRPKTEHFGVIFHTPNPLKAGSKRQGCRWSIWRPCTTRYSSLRPAVDSDQRIFVKAVARNGGDSPAAGPGCKTPSVTPRHVTSALGIVGDGRPAPAPALTASGDCCCGGSQRTAMYQRERGDPHAKSFQNPPLSVKLQ